MTKISSKIFGKTKDNQVVTAFILKNETISVTILDYGCTIQSITLLDKNNELQDIALGYNDVASYEQGTCFYGSVVGRFANRIGGAKFTIDGKEYLLEKTNGENNHVHGIFSKRLFGSKIVGNSVVFSYLSPDMEEGFPGNLNLEVSFKLTDENALEISYLATTDAPTIVNLTNHCYFNLNGHDNSTIFNHILRLNCSKYTEYHEDFSQTGKIISVENTPLDFRSEHTFKERFNDDYHQLRICTGYDHNMVIDGEENELKFVGTCRSEKTGISLEMFTTEPAIQLYSANYIQYDPVSVGKAGFKYVKNGAFCLEAQHYPDSPRYAHFPTTLLRPNEKYTQTTIYKFSVAK